MYNKTSLPRQGSGYLKKEGHSRDRGREKEERKKKEKEKERPTIMDASLRSFLSFVKTASPFYAELYKDINILDSSTTLQSLPVVPHAAYWAANTTRGNLVRTAPVTDGVVFKTGGTTSKPKATAYSQSELLRTSTQLGAGLVAAGLRPGDRVANLFYAGELWGSFCKCASFL